MKCKECKKHKVRCFAEAMKYDRNNWCECEECLLEDDLDKEIEE